MWQSETLQRQSDCVLDMLSESRNDSAPCSLIFLLSITSHSLSAGTIVLTGLFSEKSATYLCSSEKDFFLELLPVGLVGGNKSLPNLCFSHFQVISYIYQVSG